MKKILAIYVLIMLCFTPLIYQNNAHDYRPGSSGTRWGSAFGQSFYWPSYAFSAEPEADADSAESFQQSMIDIINYRNEKMFTGQRNRSHEQMISRALGNCLALAGADKDHILKLYKEMFSVNQAGKEIERIRLTVMEQMDGYDFADIIEAGAECGEDLESALKDATLSAIKDTATQSIGASTEESMAEDLTSGSMQDYIEETEANETWQTMQNNPTEFLKTCKVQGTNYAVDILQLSPAEAAIEAEQECATQLTEFKSCMGRKNANTRDCYDIVFGMGD